MNGETSRCRTWVVLFQNLPLQEQGMNSVCESTDLTCFWLSQGLTTGISRVLGLRLLWAGNYLSGFPCWSLRFYYDLFPFSGQHVRASVSHVLGKCSSIELGLQCRFYALYKSKDDFPPDSRTNGVKGESDPEASFSKWQLPSRTARNIFRRIQILIYIF